MSGHLCLKWNNHGSAFEKLLNNIHLKELYSDATLVCHGKFYPVHRFVLTTCSEYFEEIFIRCLRINNKHPFIIVKDINPLQMEALLNYMYRGEVNVPQDMLPELIKAAEAFQIKGLAVPDEDTPHRPSKRRANTSSPIPQSRKSRKYDDKSKSSDNNSDHSDSHSNSKLNKELPSYSKDSSQNLEMKNNYGTESMSSAMVKTEPIDDSDHIEEISCSKIESFVKPEQSVDAYEDSYPPFTENEDDHIIDDNFDADQSSTWENSQEFEGNDSMEGDPTQRMVTKVIGYSIEGEQHCATCSYKTNTKRYLDQHLLSHATRKIFSCPHCNHISNDKSNLNRHVMTHTGTKPHNCHICSYKSIQKIQLVMHIKNRHGQQDLPHQMYRQFRNEM